MSGASPIFTKTFDAGTGGLTKRLIAKLSADGAAVLAAAATDALLGVVADLTVVAGKRGDVHLLGTAEVVYGGNVTRGAPLTSDANGKAIAATPGAGVRIIGFAMVAGAADDIGVVQLVPGYAPAS